MTLLLSISFLLTVPPQMIDQRAISDVSPHIGRHWRKLGLKLGFSHGELDNFQYAGHLGGPQEMVQQMLHGWLQREGERATMKDLALALVNSGLGEVAQRLTRD